MSIEAPPLSLDDFVNALDPAEHEAWEDVVAGLQDDGADQRAVWRQFIALADPVLTRLERGRAGQLFGAARRAHASKTRDVTRVPLTELAEKLPYPIGSKLDGLLRAQRRREEDEPEPRFAFEICALMGLLLRIAALVGVQAYVSTGGGDAGVNHRIAAAIQRPTDGKWLELAQGLVRDLKGRDLKWLERVRATLDAKPNVDRGLQKAAGKKAPVKGHLQNLVNFRNKLIHGEPLSDADLEQAWARLQIAVRGFAWLADFQLHVRHAARGWVLDGTAPRRGEPLVELPADEPTLVHRQDRADRLSLSPLLRFRPGEGDVDFDELFFLNAGTLEQLSYIDYRAGRHLDGRALGSYEAFKAFLAQIPTPPIPREPRIDFRALARRHSPLFVGRRALLVELTDRVNSGADQYVLLKALAGMGKTAVMATLLQADLNRGEAPGVPSAADGLLRDGDRWVFHFCQPTDGRNSPTVALRSLIAQICDRFGFDREPWLSQDIEALKDERFPALLSRASEHLEGDQRLVVAIDALDEGIGADKVSVPSAIPAGNYAGVVFLLSYRVDDGGGNSRVEKQLRHIQPHRLLTAAHADPLQGLQREDVGRFLSRLQEVYATQPPSEEAEAATWAAATRDAVEGLSAGADPFYLRLVADGVQQRTIRLDRAETLPASLDDAFEEQWMGLPVDQGFLCHRVLLTLAVMREYGEDALFSEFFNRDLPEDQQLTPEDVALARREAGKLLVYDDDRYGLFHDRFKRFLVGEQQDPRAAAPELRSRARPSTQRAIQEALGAACLAWPLDADETALRSYIERHGVAHLLTLGREDDAARRMLDLHFMAAFAEAWPTVVEPLKAWRGVGLERARVGFAAAATSLSASESVETTGRAVRIVSSFLQGSGLYNAGIPLAEWSMKSAELTRGPEHPDTLTSMNNLANLYRSQGRYKEAEPLLQRAISSRERAVGPDHPDTITSLTNLAVLYQNQGRYEEAEPLFLRVLDAHERALGPDHPDTQGSLNHLANLYQNQGRYAEAESLLLRARVVCEAILGPEHPQTITSAYNLSMLYIYQGRYQEAEPILLRALVSCDRMLGPEHPSTLLTMNNLAMLYQDQGRSEEAEPLFIRTLEACERTLGADHPHTLSSVNNLAGLYQGRGRYEKAGPLFVRVLESCERLLGPEHPHTLSSVNNLALLYQSQAHYERSEPLLLRALSVCERTLGLEHPDTLTSVNNLAMLYQFQGRYEESESMLVRVLRAREHHLGPEHPSTLISVNNLAWLRLDHLSEPPREEFSRLIESWSEPTDWKHHWARLGFALCVLKDSGEDTAAEDVFAELTALLGAAHDRVLKARERIERLRAASARSADGRSDAPPR